MLRESAHLRDRILHLRTLPIFRRLPSTELAGIAEYAEERSLAIGESLFEAGEEVHTIFLLVNGRVGLYHDDREEGVIGAPGNVGSLAFLAGVSIPYDAVALEPTLVIAIKAETMLSILELNPELAREIVGYFSQELLNLRGSLPYNPDHPPIFEDQGEPPGHQGFVERLLRLRALGPFRDVNIDALAELAKAESEIRVKAGTTIWNRGDASTFAFTLVHGRVICDNGTKAIPVGFNWRLGTMDSIASAPRAYTMIADTDVVGIVSPTNAMFSVLEEQFELMLSMLNGMASAVLAERQRRFGQNVGAS